MNKKLYKFAFVFFIIMTVLFLLFSIPMAAVSFGAFLFAFVLAIITLVVAILCRNRYKDKPSTRNADLPPKHNNTCKKPETIMPDGQMNYNLLEDFIENNVLAYQYEENICIIDDTISLLQGNGGHSIDFRREINNAYDENAIAIYLKDNKIGYVYRGKIQDMIIDWLKRDEVFVGYINKFSIKDNTATYKIGFYKPLHIYENKRFPLTKITKKINDFETRYDNIVCCEDGDMVIIEKNPLLDSYIVYSETLDELGELPQSAVSFIEPMMSCEKIVGVLDNCHENEDDKIKPYVTVFLIK